jgi:hypothetical protein
MSREHQRFRAILDPGMGTLRAATIVLVVLAAPRPAIACVFFDEAAARQDAPKAAPARPEAPKTQPGQPETPKAEPAPSLDFDLLGESKPAFQVDEAAIRRRRFLLDVHAAVGLGMFALSLANTVVGQLNYSDRFASGPSTGRYQLAHQITAYGTVVAFAGTGLLALFAPTPLPKTPGFDRVTLHKLAMGAATLGMAAEVVLGIWTSSREGYLNQSNFATAHLVIGYFTFAALSLGVGTFVF